MTRLENLLYSLTTVLIRYHDYQKDVVKEASDGSDSLEARERSRLRAISIIQDTESSFNTKLNELIIKSTSNGYSKRKHFLNYIFTEIVFLKKLIDNNSPFEDFKLEEYKDRITLFFMNIRTLLGVVKSRTCHIHLQDTDDQGNVKRSHDSNNKIIHKAIALSGLINDDFFGGGYYCRSAELLDQEVLSRVNMGIYSDGSVHIPTCTDEAIAQFISDSLREHLNTLLIPQLSSENAAQKETIKTLEEISSEQVTCLYQATREIVSLNSTIDKQQDTIKELEEKVDSLNTELLALKEKFNSLITGPFPSALSTARLIGAQGGLWKGFIPTSQLIGATELPAESSSRQSPAGSMK